MSSIGSLRPRSSLAALLDGGPRTFVQFPAVPSCWMMTNDFAKSETLQPLMLTKAIIVVIILVTLLVIAGLREKQRERSLREWASHRQDAQLFWPFDPTDHSAPPIAELIERLTGHPPLSLASAMWVKQDECDVWWIEYRATPAATKSSQWFTLAVRKRCDQIASQSREEAPRSAAFSGTTLTDDSWVCERHRGLMTIKLLESAQSLPV